MSEKRLALTLWPEWAWAICHLGKDIENRDWKRDALVGQWLCIHAGKHVGGRPGKSALIEGLNSVVSVASLVGKNLADYLDPEHGPCIATSAIVAVCKVGGFLHGPPEGWYMGAPGYGWQLRDVQALRQPVPCNGAQGLWELPPDVLAAVRAQIADNALPALRSGTGAE